MTQDAITIDPERLLADLHTLGAINRAADGSCCRLALTDADRTGRDLVVSWMRREGLEVTIDRIGNIFATRAGRAPLAPVMTGSHIDTVATGGFYDGAYGVLAGLEAIRVLNRREIQTERPIVLAIFTNEEGARFQPDMMGSLVFAGGLALEAALDSVDPEGRTLGAELARIGYAGDAPCGEPRPHAFVELHIEQGPILDRMREALGAVADLQGISWQEVTIEGVSNHAGTTPMSMRNDAGYSAAAIVTFVRALALDMGDGQVGTVGSIRLAPDLINVIPRRAVLTVDLRNTVEARLALAEARLDAFLAELGETEGVKVATRRLARFEPVRFDERLVRTIQAVCAELGHPARRMTSGAGHDAQMMSRVCPSAMIFTPSVAGVSHNPREHTDPHHLHLGADVLLHTLLRLANEPDGPTGTP